VVDACFAVLQKEMETEILNVSGSRISHTDIPSQQGVSENVQRTGKKSKNRKEVKEPGFSYST
jgi:hypothetical protein